MRVNKIMSNFSISLAIAISLITVLGDYFLKYATTKPGHWQMFFLFLGGSIYALTAVGWFFLLKKMKLSSAGVIYALIIIIFNCLIGIFVFKEKVNMAEAIGIVFAITSVFLLYKFA
jgi:drug/metabolite transporter (DMT)-like permease